MPAFDRLYYINKIDAADKLDEKNFVKRLSTDMFIYRTVSDEFKVIDSDQHQVLIPSQAGEELTAAIRAGYRSRKLMREASKYCVSLYNYEYAALLKSGKAIACDDMAVLDRAECYSDGVGLIIPVSGDADYA